MLGHAPRTAAVLLLTALPSILATDCECTYGWTMVDGICTKFFSENDNSKTFQGATATCARNDGLLAVPRSESNKNELSDTANSEKIWLGLKRNGADVFRDKFGRRPTYIDWNDGEPNDRWSSEDCVELYGDSRKYNDISCKTKLGFVCVTCPPIYNRVNDKCKGCQEGWTPYKRQCLKFFTDDNTLAESVEKCAEEGATVFAPKTEQENTKMKDFAEGRITWVGYVDITEEGNWVTADTENPEAMAYSNWNDGEPNNAGEEDCASMNPNGKWNDLPCSSGLPRICVKDQENMVHLYE